VNREILFIVCEKNSFFKPICADRFFSLLIACPT
jgi:hypothetical protein